MTKLKDVKIPHLTFMQNGIEVNLGRLYSEDGKIFFKNAANVIYDLTDSATTVDKPTIDALLINAATLDSHDSLYFAKQSDLDVLADILEPSTLLTNIKTVDGTGSGLDADLLDGQDSLYFATANSLTTHQADITTHSNFAAQVTTPLAGKAAAVHTHAQSDITNLTTDLASKPTGSATTAMWNANKIHGATIPALSNVGALTSDGTNLTWSPGGGGGEVNTASNLGAGTGIYSGKVGVDIQLKSLTASGNISLTTPVAGQVNIGTTVDALARANHTGTQSADTIVDGTTNKAFTATEKTKLSTVEARSNHTGTQTASTISDFNSSVLALTFPAPDTSTVIAGTTAVTLANTAVRKSIICQNTGGLTITIPPTSTGSWTAGDTIVFLRHAAGSVTFTQGAGVTIKPANNKVISSQDKWVALYYIGSDVWNLSGDVA